MRQLTTVQLQDILADPVKKGEFLRQINVYIANVRSSSSYWKEVTNTLQNICEQVDTPSIFYTFSFSDIYAQEISYFINSHPAFPRPKTIFNSSEVYALKHQLKIWPI